MRSIILTFLLLFMMSAFAQSSKKMLLNNPQVTENNGMVEVKFSGYVGHHFVHRNYEVVLLPVLVNGNDSVVLTPIVAQNRHNRIIRERQLYAGDFSSNFPDAVFLNKGKMFTYTTVLPYEAWMNGSTLMISAYKDGCCRSESLGQEEILSPVMLKVPETVVPVVELPAPKELVKAEQSFMIEFKVSSSVLLNNYANNQNELDRLNNLLNQQVSQDSPLKLDRIEVVGYASPEGPIEFNKQLAEGRALTLKKYILKNYPIIPSDKIVIKNGDIDWNGLVKLVDRSDLKNKEQVINVIQNNEKNSDLTRKLSELDNGNTYIYLLTNIYPKLRFVYAINIYYK